jgi:hypothetical protein
MLCKNNLDNRFKRKLVFLSKTSYQLKKCLPQKKTEQN